MSRKRIVLSIVALLVITIVIALIFSISYGFFKYSKEGTKVSYLTVKGLEVSIVNKDDDALNLENMYPEYDDEGLTRTPFVFKIKNTGTDAIDYTIKIENDTDKQNACVLEDENNTPCPVLSTNYIKYVYKIGNNIYSTPAILGSNNNIIIEDTIQGLEELEISVILWIDSDTPNTAQNNYFYGKLILEGQKSQGNKYSVTFDANGGTTPITRKTVEVGEAYGSLPTPTREGYTFKGWNGKNMFDTDAYLEEMLNYFSAGRISKTTFEDENVLKIYGGVSNAEFNIDNIEQNEVYTLCLDIYNTYALHPSLNTYMVGPIFGIRYTDNSNLSIISYSGAGYSTMPDLKWDKYCVTTNSNKLIKSFVTNFQTTAPYSYVKNIQLERGNQGTDWEPYYIEDTTTVVQAQNHTLTAIWEPNAYTVTFDYNDGVTASTTKQVTYDSTYGTLPTPTREGYTFKGWNGKNLFNYQNIYKVTPGVTVNLDEWISIDTSNGLQFYNYWTNNLNLIENTQYIIITEISNLSNATGSLFVTSDHESRNTQFPSYEIPNIIPNSIYVKNIMTKTNIQVNAGLRTFYNNINVNTNEKLLFRISVYNYQNINVNNFIYEPYYIKDTTTVVQAKNHTLTAIWESS